MNPSAPLDIRSGSLHLRLQPSQGGSICGLWHDGKAVLTPGPKGMACFPLVPYSNRLAHCRFTWRGVGYTTAANFIPSPHSLHGVGWLRAWCVETYSSALAVLTYHHEPDEHWPFAFAAEQRISVAQDQLSMELSVTNTDGREQPIGLGWHPYFPKRLRSQIRMKVDQFWALDELQLPTHAIPQSCIDAYVNSLDYDHCFAGWVGPALIQDECLSLELEATLPNAVVFTPGQRNFFCIEPVSHINNAIHMQNPLAHGLVELAPGQQTFARMSLRIKPNSK